MNPSYKPWTSKKSFAPGLTNLLPRELEMIDLETFRYMKQTIATKPLPEQQQLKATPRLRADISQNVDLQTPSTHKIGALTGNSMVCSWDQARVIGAEDHGLLHGWPEEWPKPKRFSQNQLRHIYGEGVFVPQLCSVLESVRLVASAPWYSKRPAWHSGPGVSFSGLAPIPKPTPPQDPKPNKRSRSSAPRAKASAKQKAKLAE